MMAEYTLEQLRTDGLPYVMAYLIEAAHDHSTISYGAIAARLERDLKIEGKIFPIQIGWPVGTLMHKIGDIDSKAPLINILAVNQKTGVAGDGADGFLARFYRKNIEKIRASRDLKQQLVNRAVAEVYAFAHWESIAKKLFKLEFLSIEPQTIPEGTEVDHSTTPGQSRGGESESVEHYALKMRVVKQPALAGVKSEWLEARPEFQLKSGDEVDVCILTASEVYLVEVKSRRSNDTDFERGVYQCVKYREVYKAMQVGNGSTANVLPVLVTERALPPGLRRLAKQLGIAVRTLILQ
jgi:hypothetical protein